LARRFTARETALRLLARRDHSREELRQKLAAREYSDEDIESEREELSRKSLIDDGRFAEAFVRWELERGFGALAIRDRLRRKGISLPEDAIADEREIDSLRAYLQSRGIDPAAPSPAAERARLSRRLRGRGYRGSTLAKVFGSTRIIESGEDAP